MRRLLLVLLLAALPSFAQAQSFQFQYAAKFVCGRTGSNLGNFAPGTYFTTINVYNTSSEAIDKRIVVALPNEIAGGGMRRPVNVRLPPGTAMQVDCQNILAHLRADGVPMPATPVDGFVILRSMTPIDVVGVYTTMLTTGIATMETERVPARKIP
jgi:hypothetical protein